MKHGESMGRRKEHVDDGYCRNCHTQKRSVLDYGEICPKCGPPPDKPRYPPSDAQIALPIAPCKFCGRKDVSTCRSVIERSDERGKKREYTVWDARKCPAVKMRKGSQDLIGAGNVAMWYVIPFQHQRFEHTGIVLPEKEARKAKEERNMTLGGIE